MSKHLGPDAAAAVAAARKGNCKDAMKYLYDASPHIQTNECNSTRATEAAADFKTANVIVTGLCTRNAGASKRRGGGQYDFQGARRRKRR